MFRFPLRATSATLFLLSAAFAASPDRVKTANGVLEGLGPQASGVREFLGVPFAAPPVGDLRWRAPQPVRNWDAVREAKQFGPKCMQLAVFGDMGFRANGTSEDCLYLNVWTPAKSAHAKLPVLVYYFGGGFVAGDGSEPRYDGESMATKGIVSVTVSYRLGVFGFFAHPDLAAESPNHSAGNYTFLDQAAALKWVKQNIAAFGGDPNKITIAGESAGSIAVSALMASPLSRDLIAGAIGESGSILGALPAVPLKDAEESSAKFAASLNATTLAALRAIPAQQLLEAAGKPGVARFSPTVDGLFFPEAPLAIFKAGKQAHVPLLAGWNSEEMNARMVLADAEPTREGFEKAVKRLYPEQGEAVAKAYAPEGSDATQSATDLASDRFIAYSTWKWIDTCAQTGGKPVYRYYYSRPRPKMSASMGNAQAGLAGGVVRGGNAPAATRPAPKGAVHSAEIEYALGNLDSNKVYEWSADDHKVSSTMEAYFANFVKKGNPNGGPLPKWEPTKAADKAPYMRIDVETKPQTDSHRDRYLLLDKIAGQ